MEASKIIIEWEDINIRDLLQDLEHPHSLEDDIDEGMTIADYLISKYVEQESYMYILHTNFNLSKNRLMKLAAVDGVERLTPLSRYRAIFYMGKLFDVDDIKTTIRDRINKFFYSNTLREEEGESVEEGV